jgi:hypothetical protein
MLSFVFDPIFVCSLQSTGANRVPMRNDRFERKPYFVDASGGFDSDVLDLDRYRGRDAAAHFDIS